jgi:hypothetical protein
MSVLVQPRVSSVLVILAGLVLAVPVAAQPARPETAQRAAPSAAPQAPLSAPPNGDVRPWAIGVSDADQRIARELYAEGNSEFTESRFAQALAKYKEAIRHWDHPAIRFNMAVCLINLDQPVEAKDNLERSLAYRAAPLDNEMYAQGLAYRKLLDAQLLHVKATCSEPGAVVTLNGKYLFTAPGSAEQYLPPGEHQLAAIKPGFRTAFATFTGVPGRRMVHDLKPDPELGPPRWRYWKHVLGAGAVLGSAGALSYLWARHTFQAYDDEIARRCPRGCDAETVRGFTDLEDKLDGARTRQNVAFALFSAGGAAVVTGVLGLILDQPRPRPEARRAVAVVAASEGAAVMLGWSF